MKLGLAFAALLLLVSSAAAQQKQFVFGVNPYTDSSGELWSPIPTASLTGTWRWSQCAAAWKNAGLYGQQVTWDSSTGTVTIPVTNGNYDVAIYMAEPCPTETVGSRIFSLALNGTMLDPAVDIIQESGGVQNPLIKFGSASGKSIVVQVQVVKGTNPILAAISITPSPVVTAVGYQQNLTGSSFTNDTVASQGGVPCKTTYSSTTAVTANCPAGTATINASNPHRSVKTAWNAATVPPGGTPVTSYKVSRGSVAAGPFSLMATVTTLTWTDQNVKAHQQYCYTVQAVNSAGPSADATPVCVTTQ